MTSQHCKGSDHLNDFQCVDSSIVQTGLLPQENIDALCKQQDHAMSQKMQEMDTRIWELHKQDRIRKFLKLAPPSFDGTSEQLAAYDWLSEMDISGCSDEEKVAFATFLLKGSARNWWQMVNAGLQRNDKPHSSNMFKEEPTALGPQRHLSSLWDA